MSPSIKYQALSSGSSENGDLRVFFTEDDGSPISPWHDIPLGTEFTEPIFNMVVEIPRGTHAKMEIAKEVQGNPIEQDMVNGKPRRLADVFPFKGYPCNYGAFPQTWEDPRVLDPETGVKGDDDPLDACEIGSQVAAIGQIKRVKVLGAFVVLDQGETDWKVVVVDVEDPLAAELNDISDIEANMPGFLASLKNWYRVYKVSDGKKSNTLPLGENNKDQSVALHLIDRCHKEWHTNRTLLLQRSNKGALM